MQILPGTSQYPLTSGPISFLYGRSHDSLRDPEVIDSCLIHVLDRFPLTVASKRSETCRLYMNSNLLL
jgi:hypothetical protein